MFRSIQWKLVSIYILLILLAMQVVGAYLVQSLERYHFDVLQKNLSENAQLISNYIEKYLTPVPQPQEILDVIRGFPEMGTITILDEAANVIATTDPLRYHIGNKLLTPEITQATFGTLAKDMRQDPKSKDRFMYLAYPKKDEHQQLMGIVYITASMNDIYKTISDIKSILLVATSIALMITAVLGFILSKTITDPIQEVTRKAALMARGDFDQKIEVRSNDEIGKLTGMFNFLTTRLKETLDEISDEKEKVEAVLSNMADGVIALNEGGEVIHINPAALKMLSLEEDPLDKNFLQDLHRIFNVNMEETIKSGATEVLVKIRGTVVKSIIAPLQREGRSVGLILVLQDITKQHRLDAMRKEFVANVSHELRTPLATIKSYTETLLDGAMDDKEVATQFLGVVNNEADRMGRLVNDLLELSRLDNRETRWEKRSLDLGRILKDVVSKMEVSATKKRQTLVLDLPEEDGQVFADRDKLEQVFQNILSNATKYTPEGGKVAVRLRRSGNFMEVSFCDNGVGIPKGDLPRIFERFYRVDKTRSRDMGGTGLGLSIAQEIVEAHDGTIGIESETGKGTTVTISLPMLTLARENSEGHEDYDTRSK